MDVKGTAGQAYGARTTPHMYIVNSQIRPIYAGGIDSIPSSHDDDIKAPTTRGIYRKNVAVTLYSGYRVRSAKLELSRLAQEAGLDIEVHRLPPAASKWN